MTAIRLEFDAVLQVDDGAVPGTVWELEADRLYYHDTGKQRSATPTTATCSARSYVTREPSSAECCGRFKSLSGTKRRGPDKRWLHQSRWTSISACPRLMHRVPRRIGFVSSSDVSGSRASSQVRNLVKKLRFQG
jgi:hypothetical protein